MNRLLWIGLVCFIGFGVGVGCVRDQAAGGSGYDSYDTFRADEELDSCGWIMECDRMFNRPEFDGAEGACVGFFGSSPVWVAWVEQAIADGRVLYDEDAARACMAERAAAGCAEAVDLHPSVAFPACDQVLRGTLAPGADCVHGVECDQGYCEFAPECPGVCRAWVADGAACTQHGSCMPGSECRSGTWVCEPGIDIAELGAACLGTRYGCVYGAYCDRDADVCRPQKDVGQACAENDECLPGLRCDPLGTCAEVTIVREPGAACGESELRFCSWAEGLGCTIDWDTVERLTCQPLRQEGEPCLDVDPSTGQAVYTPCDPAGELQCDPESDGICTHRPGSETYACIQ